MANDPGFIYATVGPEGIVFDPRESEDVMVVVPKDCHAYPDWRRKIVSDFFAHILERRPRIGITKDIPEDFRGETLVMDDRGVFDRLAAVAGRMAGISASGSAVLFVFSNPVGLGGMRKPMDRNSWETEEMHMHNQIVSSWNEYCGLRQKQARRAS